MKFSLSTIASQLVHVEPLHSVYDAKYMSAHDSRQLLVMLVKPMDQYSEQASVLQKDHSLDSKRELKSKQFADPKIYVLISAY